MGVVLDTSIWIDVERQTLSIQEIAMVIGDVEIFLAPVVVAELEYGLERAKTPQQRAYRWNFLTLLKQRSCLTIDQTTGELVGRLMASLEMQGRSARHRLHDLWIAVVAMQYGHALLTRNGGDFQDIPGFRLIVI